MIPALVALRCLTFLPRGMWVPWLQCHPESSHSVATWLVLDHMHGLRNVGSDGRASSIAVLPEFLFAGGRERPGSVESILLDCDYRFLVHCMIELQASPLSDASWVDLLASTFGVTDDGTRFQPSLWCWRYGPMAQWITEMLMRCADACCDSYDLATAEIQQYTNLPAPHFFIVRSRSMSTQSALAAVASRARFSGQLVRFPLRELRMERVAAVQLVYCFAKNHHDDGECFQLRDEASRVVVVQMAGPASLEEPLRCADSVVVLFEPAPRGNSKTTSADVFGLRPLARATTVDLSACHTLTVLSSTTGAPRLQRLELPRNLEVIAGGSFSKSEMLQWVDVSHCVALKTINGFDTSPALLGASLPPSVAEIGRSGFSRCKALTMLDLSRCNGLRLLEGPHGLNSLAALQWPRFLREIGVDALRECPAVETVDLGSCAVLSDVWGFQSCRKLRRVVLPESVCNIGSTAFAGCEGLREVAFLRPSRLANIEGFDGCPALSDVTFDLPELTTIGVRGFASCTSLRVADLSRCVNLRIIFGFANCTMLEVLKLPLGLRRIGHSAFHRCGSLASLDMRHCDLLEEIDGFTECSALQEVCVPAALLAIGERAFDNCANLKTLDCRACHRLRASRLRPGITILPPPHLDQQPPQ